MKIFEPEHYNWPKYLAVMAVCAIAAVFGMFTGIPEARAFLLRTAAGIAIGTTLLFLGQQLYHRYRSR